MKTYNGIDGKILFITFKENGKYYFLLKSGKKEGSFSKVMFIKKNETYESKDNTISLLEKETKENKELKEKIVKNIIKWNKQILKIYSQIKENFKGYNIKIKESFLNDAEYTYEEDLSYNIYISLYNDKTKDCEYFSLRNNKDIEQVCNILGLNLN